MVKVIIFSFFLSSLVWAQIDKKQTVAVQTVMVNILKKYKKAKSVEISVDKAENKKALGTEKKSSAKIVYSGGKINFSTETPTKSEIIYNKNVWIIEYPDLELDAKAHRKVTILNSNKVAFIKKMTQILNGNIKVKNELDLIKVDANLITAEIKMEKVDSLKKVLITFDSKNEVIQSIQTVDDVDTETNFTFTNTQFLKKVANDKLTFKKLKTDEIFKP